eukprot:4191692-Lingulodinium_polyedra.AAC.1
MKVPLNDVPNVFDILEPHAARHHDLLDGKAVLRRELVAIVKPADAVGPVRLAVDELEPCEEVEARRVHVVDGHGAIDLRSVGGALDEGVEAGR